MRLYSICCTIAALILLAGTPSEALGQRRLDPRSEPGLVIDANLAYVMIAGEIGDSVSSGPGADVAVLYQLADIPLRLGAGGGYSRHGLDDPMEGGTVEGSADKFSAFAAASLLLFSRDTEMIPYIQARLGWTWINTSSGGFDSSRSGLEVAALVGVDVPVAERLSIDVTGLFGWISGGDASQSGITIPGTSRGGSIFAIRAGAAFFL